MARLPTTQDIALDPEADRLAGTPHPRRTVRLYGHDGAEELLAEAVASGRLHHGWLITGAEGIGKATLAYRLAKHLLAEPAERDPFGRTLDVDPMTRAGRQVVALSHPGLLVLRRVYDAKVKRFTTGVSVDEVRRLRTFLAHAADAGAWRVVLVDTADDLNANAANALLKSLEEPPQRTVFILLTAEPGRLLPTIRSRCRRLDLSPLGSQDLRAAATAALAAEGGTPPSDAIWPELEALAEGSVRRALTIAGSDGLAQHERVVRLLTLLPKVDWPAAHAMADELSAASAEANFEAFYESLFSVLARAIRARATGTGRPADCALAGRMIAPHLLPRWVDTWTAMQTEKVDGQAINLDRKTLVLATLTRLEATARGQ
jgi:DNA polymerase-3 subunit delta'